MMKKYIFHCLTGLASILVVLPTFGTEVTILPKGETNVRTDPNLTSEIVARLPMGSILRLLEKSKERSKIDKLSDNWCKVTNEKIHGWVFCAYVGRYYRKLKWEPVLTSYIPSGVKILNIKTTNIGPQGINRSVGSETRKITTYDNGIIHTDIAEYEGGGYEIFFPDANLYEGFLMIRDCHLGGSDKEWSEIAVTKESIEFHEGGNVIVIIRRKGTGIEIKYSWAA